jgi:hypothetical protein
MLTKLRSMLFALLALFAAGQAAEPGNPQQLVSPDQTPQDLGKTGLASFLLGSVAGTRTEREVGVINLNECCVEADSEANLWFGICFLCHPCFWLRHYLSVHPSSCLP